MARIVQPLLHKQPDQEAANARHLQKVSLAKGVDPHADKVGTFWLTHLAPGQVRRPDLISMWISAFDNDNFLKMSRNSFFSLLG